MRGSGCYSFFLWFFISRSMTPTQLKVKNTKEPIKTAAGTLEKLQDVEVREGAHSPAGSASCRR